MPQELLIAIIAGLGGMFGWGFADFFAKKTISSIGDTLSLAWAGVFGTVVFLLAAAYQLLWGSGALAIPQDLAVWLGLAFFGALQAGVYLFAYKGFGKGEILLLAPVFASFSGIVALISILFLGEPVTAPHIMALVVIFGGVMLMSIDLNAFRGRVDLVHVPGLKEVLIATLLAALWTVLWDQFVSGQDWLAYALYMFAFMTIAVFVMAKVQGVLRGISSRNVWIFVALIGISETVAYLAISLGYSATSFTSIVTLISGAFSLPTIILARIFLEERPTRVQTLGSMFIISGIAALSLL